VAFDVVLAYFVMKIVSLKTESANMRILAFVLAFAIPTVVLNSAMWGQCDSIYTAFLLGSIYFALCGKSKMTFAFLALALSFKLQAAFLFPVFAVFVIKDKIKLYDCYVFFLVYLATLLPAALAGRPVIDLLFVYFNQSVSYHFMTLNAMNIWRLVGDVAFFNFRIVGLFSGGVAALGLLYFTYVHKERLVHTADYVRLAFLYAMIVPFFLPQMHDRFFYMADVLSLTVFLFDKRRWYVPLITVFCSYTAYAWYLKSFVPIDHRYTALAMMVVIFIVLRDYVVSLRGECGLNDNNDNM